jgi:hypothetical protein
MNKVFTILLVPIGLSLAPKTFGGTLPSAKVTIKVVEAGNSPIQDATVRATFQNATLDPKNWGTGRDNRIQTASTDQQGVASLEGYSDGELGGGVRKDGYYRGWWNPYKFPGKDDGRWQPWNPTIQVTLRRIMSPIPMYARRVNTGLPNQNQDIGFDLFVGDFVTPYGKGRTSDMIFRADINERGRRDFDYKLTVAFPNKQDGIVQFDPAASHQNSILRSGYNVPDVNLLSSWTVTRTQQPGSPEQSNYDPTKHCYYFRVRTAVDGNGKIASANYGKIYGDFMNFTYYLNPTPNDRNVEFDPKRNLFTNLKPEERVTDP